MRNFWIFSIFMAVFPLDNVLMATRTGTYYEAIYLSNLKQEKEQEILHHVQKYLHRCSIKSTCNYVVEDKMNGVKMFNSRSEFPAEEEMLGIWMKMPRQYTYRLSKEKLNWHEARAKCQLHGGDLASITNKQEDRIKDLLSNFASDRFIWVGLNDIDKEGKYVWSDGSDYSYENWGRGDPNNHLNKEHCIVIMKSLKWYDYECGKEEYFICKYILS